MKNLFKKIGALLVAAVMVLSMCTAAFAAELSTSITVNNAEGADLSYIQVIRPNVNKTTGWEFCSPGIENAYEKALSIDSTKTKDADQVAIQKLINAAENKEGAATSSEIEAALNAVIALGGLTGTTNPIPVSDAGVYAINATDTTHKWSYNPMAAYVSFGAYDATTGEPTTLVVEPVNAKRTPLEITKKATDNDIDNVTEIGRKETYTVSSSVPYIPLSKTEKRYYRIKDTIKGAQYVTTTDSNNKKIVNIQFTISGQTSNRTAEVTDNNNGTQSFVLDLSDLVVDANNNASNEKANVQYSFTYEATVTEKAVNNTIIGYGENDTTPEFGGGTSKLYTGSVTLTKYGENQEKLAGAGFTVTKKGEDGKTADLKFRAVKTDAEGNPVPGEYEYDPNGTITEVFTGEGGTLTIKGLDVSKKDEVTPIKYSFTEKTAPKGYKLNGTSSTTTAKLTVEKAEDEVTIAPTTMQDTKLSSLPSTGGMGTYLFTIIGVVVMAGAAGAFFISRRKGSEE